jgi:hypothetical protein
MNRCQSITIRQVESSDLETFYEHQLDPEAITMAAFVSRDSKDNVALVLVVFCNEFKILFQWAFRLDPDQANELN